MLLSLREKCPNTELMSIFSPNTGKHGPEKTPYLDTFHAVSYNFDTPNATFEHYYPFSNLYQCTFNILKFFSNKKLENEKLNKKGLLFQKCLELHLLFVFYEKIV